MTQKTRLLLFVVLLGGLVLGVGGAAGGQIAPDTPAANAGWEEVGVGSASGGGISQSLNPSSAPAIAFDTDGNPVIVWTENVEEDWEIYIRRWDGFNWVEMGSGSASGNGISDDGGESQSPALAVAPDGSIVVVWTNYYDDFYNGSDIFVRHWDGISWEEMGNGSAVGGGISQTADHGSEWPTLIIDSDGMPVIGWSEHVGNNTWEIYVRRWDGVSWSEMGIGSGSSGGISNNGGYSIAPSLAISPDGTPAIAWGDNSGGDHEIYIRRWDGSAWVEANSASAYGGGISDDYTQSTEPSLAFFPSGKPMVAWVNYSGSAEEQWDIFARRWDGASWIEMDGSASSGGISQNHSISLAPSLAILPDGSPLIVWADQTEAGPEIYALRWNGSSWVEAGQGSASAGGISDGNGSSEYPALVIDPDGRAVVAWGYWDGNLADIFVRRSPQL
ncbi:MAG TPA: sialidase family protein, partial [Promineifilum sp.]|nr:sialidase family protein [Promineifilum sp.]